MSIFRFQFDTCAKKIDLYKGDAGVGRLSDESLLGSFCQTSIPEIYSGNSYYTFDFSDINDDSQEFEFEFRAFSLIPEGPSKCKRKKVLELKIYAWMTKLTSLSFSK